LTPNFGDDTISYLKRRFIMKQGSNKKTAAKKTTVKKVSSRKTATVAKKKTAKKPASAKKSLTTKLGRKIKAIKKKAEKRAGKRTVARKTQSMSTARTRKVPSRAEVPLFSGKEEAISAVKETIEAAKFNTVQTTVQPREVAYDYNLPQRYYDDKIVLLARDPWWLHSYWDISETRINQVIDSIPSAEREGLHWVLRLHDVTGVMDFDGSNGHSFYDTEINSEVRSWYLNPNSPEREWCIDIGFKNKDGKFFLLARSNLTKSPYFGISSVVDEEWALPDEEYYKALGVYEMGRSSFEHKKKLEESVLSQISSGGFSPGISSVSSPFGGRKKERKFFLEVWTELILYGRTEADALVTVEGKPVKLRPDGTFTLRYALPEGDFKYQVEGTSADKVETRTITPAVKRTTKENKRKLHKK